MPLQVVDEGRRLLAPRDFRAREPSASFAQVNLPGAAGLRRSGAVPHGSIPTVDNRTIVFPAMDVQLNS